MFKLFNTPSPQNSLYFVYYCIRAVRFHAIKSTDRHYCDSHND